MRRRRPEREVHPDRPVMPAEQLPAGVLFGVADRYNQPLRRVRHIGFPPTQLP
jgi:hypothetical protein